MLKGNTPGVARKECSIIYYRETLTICSGLSVLSNLTYVVWWVVSAVIKNCIITVILCLPLQKYSGAVLEICG